MRSFLSLAVIGAAALLPLTASAQHGRGGHASSGSSRSSGFSGGHVGSAAPRGFSSSRVSGGFSTGRPSGTFAPTHRAFVSSRPTGRFQRFGGFNRFDRFDRFPRPFIFSGGCIHGSFFSGFPCRRFFFGGSFVLGYAPLYADYSYYPEYAYPPPPPPVAAYNNNDSELTYQVERLSGEVEQLRDNEDNRQRYDQRPAQPRESAYEPSAVATLVFRDGRRLSVPNYAITGQTIWILNDRTARKIPLADLDIAATQHANEANGVDFRLR